jgi:hypothetical protein
MGISLLAPLLVIPGLLGVPALTRHETDGLAVVGPAAAAVGMLFVGAGIIQLSLSAGPVLMILAAISVAIGFGVLAAALKKFGSHY